MLYRFHHLHGVILMPDIPRFRCFQIHQPSFAIHTTIFHIPRSYIPLKKHSASGNNIAIFHCPDLYIFFHEKATVCAHSS